MKKAPWLLPGCFILLVLARPETAARATLNALSIWYKNVLPTLVPCFIGALMLEKSGVAGIGAGRKNALLDRLYGMDARAIPLLLLCFCAGSPTSAKILREQTDKGVLTRAQARTLLCAVSTVSPGFILGTLGTQTLGRPLLGLWILSAHLLGALICGVLFAEKGNETPKGPDVQTTTSLSGILCQALGQTGQAMLSVAASMAFFSVLLSFLPPRLGALSMLLEMTAGCSFCAAQPFSQPVRALALCATVSFGGLCLGVQSLVHTGDLMRAGSYFLRKAIHCAISVALIAPVLWL